MNNVFHHEKNNNTMAQIFELLDFGYKKKQVCIIYFTVKGSVTTKCLRTPVTTFPLNHTTFFVGFPNFNFTCICQYTD